jgi:hypothetical protein
MQRQREDLASNVAVTPSHSPDAFLAKVCKFWLLLLLLGASAAAGSEATVAAHLQPCDLVGREARLALLCGRETFKNAELQFRSTWGARRCWLWAELHCTVGPSTIGSMMPTARLTTERTDNTSSSCGVDSVQ